MNRIAAAFVLAASIVVPTIARAESAPPVAAKPAAETQKSTWIRILPATQVTLGPTAPVTVPGANTSFGIRFDMDAIKPAPASTSPQLLGDVPGIPLVVLRF